MNTVKVEKRSPYQGVPQYGITGANEITPSRKTAQKWADLENARLRHRDRAHQIDLAIVALRHGRTRGQFIRENAAPDANKQDLQRWSDAYSKAMECTR